MAEIEVPAEVLAEPFSYPKAIKHIALFSIPMSLSQMTFSLVPIIGVFFAGKLGVTELGAAALTFSFINATSFSVSAGFCGALETFFSHSYGENPQSKKYGTYAQRMIILLLVISFPLAALFAYAEPLMLLMGQEPGVSREVAVFTQIALVGLVPSMMMELIRRYYQAQHQTLPITIATAVGSFIINPCAMLLLLWLGLGFKALPLAWSLLQVLLLAALVAYAYRCGLVERTWGGWDRDALRHWGPMMRLGVLSFLMMVSEFIVVEINSMSAGFLGEVQLAAFSITAQLSFFAWNVVAGVFASMSVLVGTFIGSGQPIKANQYAIAGTILSTAVSTLNAACILIFGPTVARTFTDSEEVLEAIGNILPLAALFHFADAPQSNALGILRGAGMQKRGAIAVTVSYAVVGMPLGWILCFYFRLGAGMLWVGPALGCMLVGWPMCGYSIFKTDWTKLTVVKEKPVEADFE